MSLSLVVPVVVNSVVVPNSAVWRQTRANFICFKNPLIVSISRRQIPEPMPSDISFQLGQRHPLCQSKLSSFWMQKHRIPFFTDAVHGGTMDRLISETIWVNTPFHFGTPLQHPRGSDNSLFMRKIGVL